MTENTEKTYKKLMFENALTILTLAELGPNTASYPSLMIKLCENMKEITTKMDKDGLL